jgi:hypothetical protein
MLTLIDKINQEFDVSSIKLSDGSRSRDSGNDLSELLMIARGYTFYMGNGYMMYKRNNSLSQNLEYTNRKLRKFNGGLDDVQNVAKYIRHLNGSIYNLTTKLKNLRQKSIKVNHEYEKFHFSVQENKKKTNEIVHNVKFFERLYHFSHADEDDFPTSSRIEESVENFTLIYPSAVIEDWEVFRLDKEIMKPVRINILLQNVKESEVAITIYKKPRKFKQLDPWVQVRDFINPTCFFDQNQNVVCVSPDTKKVHNIIHRSIKWHISPFQRVEDCAYNVKSEDSTTIPVEACWEIVNSQLEELQEKIDNIPKIIKILKTFKNQTPREILTKIQVQLNKPTTPKNKLRNEIWYTIRRHFTGFFMGQDKHGQGRNDFIKYYKNENGEPVNFTIDKTHKQFISSPGMR